jgi:hypothetical protein
LATHGASGLCCYSDRKTAATSFGTARDRLTQRAAVCTGCWRVAGTVAGISTPRHCLQGFDASK